MVLYKSEKTYDERLSETKAMLSRFSDRIPIIVEKKKDTIQTIDKRKFMVPRTLTMSQFVFVIRKRLKLKSTEAIFVFCNNRLVNQSTLMSDIYESDKDDDGFLYLIYDFENTFG